MPVFDSSLIPSIESACQSAAGDVAHSLGQLLGLKLTIDVGAAAPFETASPGDLGGPGLAIALAIGDAGGLVLLSEATGLLPAWYAEPDVTGQSRLATIAQEFSLQLVPEGVDIEAFRAAHVDDLAAAVLRATPTSEAVVIPLTTNVEDGRTATLHYILPCSSVLQALIAFEEPGEAVSVEVGGAANDDTTREKPAGVLRGAEAERAVEQAAAAAEQRRTVTLEDLPPYTKSLLRIRVPVMVTLAEKKQPISKILEIGPGTILQFQKPCDQLLELEVNGHKIGVGEAVKVGDKFGLRVTGMTLPGERFTPLGKAS